MLFSQLPCSFMIGNFLIVLVSQPTLRPDMWSKWNEACNWKTESHGKHCFLTNQWVSLLLSYEVRPCSFPIIRKSSCPYINYDEAVCYTFQWERSKTKQSIICMYVCQCPQTYKKKKSRKDPLKKKTLGRQQSRPPEFLPYCGKRNDFPVANPESWQVWTISLLYHWTFVSNRLRQENCKLVKLQKKKPPSTFSSKLMI